jgi:hypothetical protein
MYEARSNHIDQSIVVEAQISTFRDLNEKQPGRWVLSQGEKSFMCDQGVAQNGRGAFLTLAQAVPIPDSEVPLEEVLNFKRRYRDEIYELKTELDAFYNNISISGDSEHFLQSYVKRIDVACSGYIKAAKGQGFPIRLSSFGLEYSLPIGGAVGAFLPSILDGSLRLPATSELIVGAAATLVSGVGIGLAKPNSQVSPFRVVGKMHRLLSD